MKTPTRRKQTQRKKPRRKKTPVATIPSNPPVEFPEVKGKTVEALKLYLESDEASIALSFADKTYLQFDLEPGLTVRTDYSDWKTHNWRGIKRWPPFRTPSAWVREPG
jgi:hypothetical protein